MTLSELAHQLPWGFHDAYLTRLGLDWVARELVFEARVPMDSHQGTQRRVRVTVRGLHFFVATAPRPTNPDLSTSDDLPWIDSGEGRVRGDAEPLPAVPAGHFLHHFVISETWQYLYICGRDCELTWLDQAPTPSQSGRRAAFPGESIPFRRMKGDEDA